MKVPMSLTAIVYVLLCPLTAGPIPGRWEKVDSLPQQSDIIITLRTGEQIQTVFLGATADSLTVRDDSGQASERKIRKSDVQTVSRKHSDSLAQGMLLGAGIGYAAMFGTVVAAGRKASDPAAPIAAIWGFVGAGVGALIGGAADSAVQETEVLYFTNGG